MYKDEESEQYGTKQPMDHGLNLKNTKANKKPTTTKNLQDAAKAILRRDFIVIQVYLREKKKNLK